MWQLTNDGQVNGIYGYVDIDVMYEQFTKQDNKCISINYNYLYDDYVYVQ